MTKYEIACVVISCLAFCLSFVSCLISFIKYKRQQPKISFELEEIVTGIDTIEVNSLISNNSEIDTNIKRVTLKLDSKVYKVKFTEFFNNGKKNCLIKSSNIFLSGHQSISIKFRFTRVDLSFQKAVICIETTDNDKKYKFDITEPLLNATGND